MVRKILCYDPVLKERARKLRNNSTVGEIVLWKKLRGKQMKGYDFHRQKPIDHFIVDFFCHELSLAIEIDGFSHESEEAKKMDGIRQSKLEQFGIKFLRFKESEVKKDPDGVVKAIEYWITQHHKKAML